MKDTFKFTVKTLGCKVNRVESETMMLDLAGYDVELVDEYEHADAIIVNTCSVTGAADAKTRKAIRKMARSPRCSSVIVTGCSAALHEKELLQLDEKVRVIVDKSAVAGFIADSFSLRVTQRDDEEHRMRHENEPLFRTRSFVKVQDGCENFCSYCIVPYARGVCSSTPFREIVARVENLVSEGTKEIVLTGINIGRYRDEADGIFDISDLIEAVAETGIERIRVSSIEPVDVDEKFASLFERVPQMCEHVHIPLQSGSNTVLQRMNRRYTTEEFAQSVALLRAASPDIALTTDVIVGYPRETDEEFDRTVRFCEEIGFSKIHVFRYSPRNGTPAALEEQIPSRIVASRADELGKVSDGLVRRYRARFVGKPLEVLVERNIEGKITGTSREYLHVELDFDTYAHAEISPVHGGIITVIG